MRKKSIFIIIVFALIVCMTILISACSNQKRDKDKNSGNINNPHEHTFSDEWKNDDSYHWHVATCEHEDLISGYALHQWDDGEISKQATTIEQGEKIYTCTICETTKTEAIPVLFSYVVCFYDWDETLLATVNVLPNGTAQSPGEPIREGHRFDGWDQSLENIQSNLDVTAQYVKTYTVQFVDYNNSIIDIQFLDFGQSAVAPENPTRVDYLFTGWDTGFTGVTEDITVRAVYIRQYKVMFEDYNGKVLKEEIVSEGNSATAPESPNREGFTFVGWDLTFDEITNDKTVKAIYSINIYDVSFRMPDGNVISNQKIKHGFRAQAPNVSDNWFDWKNLKGYSFTGWDNKFDVITDDTVITAKYDTQISGPIFVVNTEEYHNVSRGTTQIVARVYLCGTGSMYGFSLSMEYDEIMTLGNNGVKLRIPNATDENSMTNLDDSRKTFEVAWSSYTSVAITRSTELLEFTFSLPYIVEEGDYFIDILSKSFFINEGLEKITPIVISGYITIIG